MQRNRWLIYLSLLIIPIIIGIYCLDIIGNYSFSDTPFAIALVLYLIFTFIQRPSCKYAFGMSLLFLIVMGISYIPTGEGKMTERTGEWFYLFFVFGLIQYIREAWKEKL
jgi:hypothetical protein